MSGLLTSTSVFCVIKLFTMNKFASILLRLTSQDRGSWLNFEPFRRPLSSLLRDFSSVCESVRWSQLSSWPGCLTGCGSLRWPQDFSRRGRWTGSESLCGPPSSKLDSSTGEFLRSSQTSSSAGCLTACKSACWPHIFSRRDFLAGCEFIHWQHSSSWQDSSVGCDSLGCPRTSSWTGFLTGCEPLRWAHASSWRARTLPRAKVCKQNEHLWRRSDLQAHANHF